MYYTDMKSPVGLIRLAADGEGLKHVQFLPKAIRPDAGWEQNEKSLREAVEQLQAYFDGRLTQFSLPLAPDGTPFQRKVFEALLTVPYGDTASYADIARRIGHPKAARAVGAANGLNPLPIVIPCHRIIGANGQLVGFSAGLAIKEKLLQLERTFSLQPA